MPEPDPGCWSRCSFEGNRRAQQEQFMALSFREKLIRLEQMADVQRALSRRAPRPYDPSEPSGGSGRAKPGR